jgi:hypothetical protein
MDAASPNKRVNCFVIIDGCLRTANDYTVHGPRLPLDFCPKCGRDLRGGEQ